MMEGLFGANSSFLGTNDSSRLFQTHLLANCDEDASMLSELHPGKCFGNYVVAVWNLE